MDLKAGVALQWVVVIRALRNSGFAALRTFQFKFKSVARCHNAEYVLFGRTGKAFSQPYSKLTHYMRNSQGHIAADVACYNRLMGMTFAGPVHRRIVDASLWIEIIMH